MPSLKDIFSLLHDVLMHTLMCYSNSSGLVFYFYWSGLGQSYWCKRLVEVEKHLGQSDSGYSVHFAEPRLCIQR